MADQKIGAANIEVGVTSTVPQDLEASKKSLKDFANVTRQAGDQVQQSMEDMGASVAKMEVTSENLNKTQRRTADSIIRSAQRQSSDTKAAYLDWVAAQAGVTNATQAARDKLRQWEAGQAEAVSAGRKYIQMLKEQTETIGMNRREMLQYQAAQLGVSDQAAPFINKMFDTSKAFTSVEMSAKQTRQAMRMLPAQITDVVTSLASGMPMYLVAIQQGGQLRDSFGGFGNVLRGVAALISPTVLAITSLAAVGGATYLAYESAASIMREFERMLISSGNSAGLTSSQLSNMAKEVSSITGTQKQASGALNAIISSNSLLGQSYTAIAAASVNWSKATGESVDKVVEKFVSLSKDPSKAMEELDGQFNFLTVSTYEQVTALIEQGRKSDASRILIEALSNTMTERAPQMIEQTNAFARAWDSVSSSAKKAFESFGQALSAPTLEQEYNDALKTYFDFNKQLEDLQNSSTMNVLREEEIRQLQQLIENHKTYLSSLNDQIVTEAKLAEESRIQAEQKKNLAAINNFLREGMTAEEKVQSQINIVVQEYVNLLKQENLTKLQKIAIDSAMAERINKIWEGYLKQIDTGKGVVRTTKDVNEEIRKQIENYRFETDLLIMNTQERERAKFVRDMESKGIEENSAAWRENLDAFNAAMMERMQQQSYLDYLKREKKAQEDAIKARLKSEEKYAKEVEKINDQIGQSLTDALMRGGMNAKDFLINMFKTMVLRPILQPIITSFVGALGAGAAGAALAGNAGAAAGGASSMSQASGLLGIVSAAKTAYEVVTGGFAAIGNSVSSIAAAIQYNVPLFSEQAAMLAAQEAGMSSMVGMVGTAAQYLAGIGAGVMAGQMISGKYSVGGSSYLATGAGSIIGAIVGGPIGAAIGGAIGGVINRAFGMAPKETTSAGYDLTLAASGAIATGFEKWEQSGGWFRSSRSGKEITAVAQETVDFFNQSAMAISSSVTGMSTMMGASLDNINNFKLDIVIETLNATKEQIEEQIGGAFKYMETSLVEFLIPGIYEFAAAGDKTASDILKRLVASVTTVNQAFEILGYNLYEVSLQGADAASKLVSLFGGLENFSKSTSFYYENFYSAQEKVNFQTEQLTKIFGAMNLALPESNAGFRQLVEAAQAAGNDQLFATLVQLAPSFDTLQKAMQQLNATTEQTIEQTTNASKESLRLMAEEARAMDRENKLREQAAELRQEIDAYFPAQIKMRDLSAQIEAGLAENASAAEYEVGRLAGVLKNLIETTKKLEEATKKAQESLESLKQAVANELKLTLESLQKTYETERNALKTRQSLAQENIRTIEDVFNTLDGAIQNIVNTTQTAMSAAQGLRFVQQALETAQRTGYLPDNKLLGQAITSAQGGLGAESFASSFEMRRSNMLFAAQLSQLREVTEIQKTDQERILENSELQLKALEDQYNFDVDFTKQYYDAILKTAEDQLNATQNVDSTLYSVADAIKNFTLSMSTLFATQKQMDFLEKFVVAGMPQNPYLSRQITQEAEIKYLDTVEKFNEIANKANISSLTMQTAMGAGEMPTTRRGWEYYGAQRNWLPSLIPIESRAAGGFTLPGMTLVGENGPELIDFKSPGMVYSNDKLRSAIDGDTASEIRALREENRAQSRSMVSLQARMTRLIERWDGDGLPEERVVTA